MSQLQPPDRGLVSVVVPAHDQGGTVALFVGKAFAQTGRPWELVYVDDGWTDGAATAVQAAAEAEPVLAVGVSMLAGLLIVLVGLLAELVVNVSERVDRLERRMTPRC